MAVIRNPLARLPLKDVIISVIMTLGSIALFLYVGGLEDQIAPAGVDLPHRSRSGYSDEAFWAVLTQIGPEGRDLYRTALRWDFWLIAVVTFSLAAIGYFGLGTTFGQWRARDLALLGPLAYGTADIIENLSLLAAITAFDAGSAGLAAPSSLVTQFKFVFLYASLAFLPLATIRLSRMLRSPA